MEFRVGTCTSCNKKFKVPATFQSDKAKCKHCGGVVEIGATTSSAKKPAAAKPVPVPAKPAAAKQARAGARAGAAAAGVAKAAASSSVRAKARAAGERVKAAGVKTPGAKAPNATGVKAAGVSARAGSARSSSSGSRRSRAKPAPKKSNVGMIVGVVLLLAAVGTGAFFMLKDKGDNATQAAETNLAQAEANPLAETAPEESNPAPVETEQETAEPAGSETAPEPDPDPEPSAPAQPAEVVLLDLIEELPDLEPLPGTAPERAAEMRQWMAEYIDPNAGAAGNRAGKRLQESPKEAFPFIINAFKRIDTTSEDGFRAGDLTQKLLERICHGNNFDWKYPAPGASTLEPKEVLFNQKVVKAWHKIWLQAKDDEATWLKLTKQAAKPEAKKADTLDDF